VTRLWFSSALLPTGWADAVRLTVTDGLIDRVDVGVAPGAGDDRHGAAVPGLPNVHSHTFQRAMAGLTERRGGPAGDDFWTWRELMYRFVDRLEPDDVEAVAAMAFAEMLETGFTRVGEFHYLHHDPTGARYANPAELAVRIVAASSATGIGLTLLPVFYAHSNFGGIAPTHGQRRFVTTPDEFARLLEASRGAIAGHPGSVLGVAPHSLRAVTPDELRAVVQLVPPTAPVHIHVSEQTKEVDDCLAWCGRRPVEWLLDQQELDTRWCLIHATHTTPAELAGVASRGSVVGLCPVTEANLGDGVFDAKTFRATGGRFGIGTDSNVLIDVAGELRQLEYAQRLATRGRNVLATEDMPSVGRALFESALQGGSQALGVAGAGLSAGQPADVVALGSVVTGDQLLDVWVFASRIAPIESVWCRGRQVVVEGRHVERDAIERRYRAVIDRCSQGR
jgi:formiminoglutamate deiminase